MTNTGADMHAITLEKGLATFLNALSGKNRSAATIRAYQTDISQFIAFLHDTNVSIHTPAEVEKIDVMEYLTSCAKRELTGWSCARTLRIIPFPPKPGKMPSSQHQLEGAMPWCHRFFSISWSFLHSFGSLSSCTSPGPSARCRL